MPQQPFRVPFFRISTRRLTVFLALLSFSAISAIILLSSTIPQSPSLFDYDGSTRTFNSGTRPPSEKDASVRATLQQPSHAPPRQRNDEYAGSSWWTDENWLAAPFSNAFTTDSRSLLPPLKTRPAIYCYHDNALERTPAEGKAEEYLLLTWKRAWWAHGFRPMVMTPEDAARHPRFDGVRNRKLETGVELDLMRWLAWDAVGGGLLSECTLLPMGLRDDGLLMTLRQGGYSGLTSWLGALIAGPPEEVASVVEAAIQSSARLSQLGSVLEFIPEKMMEIRNDVSSLAYYDARTISANYPAVAEAASEGHHRGLQALDKIMNAHLQIVWQRNFPDGVEVLKPLPKHTSKMIGDAVALAHALFTCPETPMPSSCPPNIPDCHPCVKKPRITATPCYHDDPVVFSLGVVPHPWTLATLDLLRDTLDMSWIHRESGLNPWVTEVTACQQRESQFQEHITTFKDIVIGDHSTLWLTAEDAPPPDLDWFFGFKIPPQRWYADTAPANSLDPSEDPALEWILLERARHVVLVAGPSADEDAQIKDALEGYNTADMEAWKFVRALQARRSLEVTL